MPELNIERLQAASQAKYGVDANLGLQLATGINADINGIINRLYGGDWNSGVVGTDTILELFDDVTIVGGTLGNKTTAWNLGGLTKRVLTADSGTYVASQDANGYLDLYNSTAAVAHTSNQREIFTTTASGANWESLMLYDMPGNGVDTGGGNIILMQGGTALRYQNDTVNHRAVTIDNNIAFGSQTQNLGVWSSTVAGASFLNRQGAIGAAFTNPAYPIWIKTRLVGTILETWTWNASSRWFFPPTVDADNHYEVVNLDTAGEAGTAPEISANPTPSGAGNPGIIVAHGGNNTNCRMKVRFWQYRVID